MKKQRFAKFRLYSTWYVLVNLGFLFLISSCKDKEKPDETIVIPEPVSPSPKAEIYDVQVASEWNDLHLQLLENNTSLTSLSAARSLGYVNLALYESVVHGTESKSLENRLRGFTNLPEVIDSLEYNWGLAANVAQYTMVQLFFPKATPQENAAIDALLSKYEREFRTNSSQEVIRRSIEFGAAVANSVWTYARRDGLNGTDSLLFDSNYIFPSGLGVWKPQPIETKPLLPQWKLLRPMIFANKFLTAKNNIPFSYRKESTFFAEANRVFQASVNPTAIQEEKSQYWVGTELSNNAVRHIFGVLNEAVKRKDVKLDEAVLSYLKGGIVVFDGSIAVWRNKFENNLIRPDTYIRETLDKNWVSALGTSYSPAFPSLTTTLAGAISKLLQEEIGGGVPTPFSTTPLSFAEFKNEVIAAEVDGGTNFAFSAESGYVLGEQIMENTLAFDF